MYKEIKLPHTFALIFILIIIIALSTYFIPAGEYERIENPVTGVMEVTPDSYEEVEKNPASIGDVLKSVPIGMNQAAWIIFLIFIFGGSFGMINGTGALEIGIFKLVNRLGKKEVILIPVTMFIFALGGATFGMAESTLVFIPVGVMLAKNLNMDSITGMAIVALGAAAGFASGALNPFTVGVAQSIAGLPLFSGMLMRWAMLIVFVGIASIYVLRYAKKVQKEPHKSVVYNEGSENLEINSELEEKSFNNRHKASLLVILLGFCIVIYGVLNGWSTSTDLTATFLGMGIIAGLVGGSGPSKLSEDFLKGAEKVTYGALIVGLAHGIIVILSSAKIIDTLIFNISSIIAFLPTELAAIAMFFVQVALNFFIPSGSGQAAVTIPIMVPIGELVGITRQSVVLAYQLGDGLSNYLFPTSGILMAGLSLANIPYTKWFKWVLPLMLLWFLASAFFMWLSVYISYGPF